MARPDESGTVPTVFVIPGIDGLGSFEKDTCRRLARSGIAALSVDLYRGPGDSLDLYNSMSDDEALNTLDELHQFLTAEAIDWNNSEEVGLLGIDTGGRFALIRAATRSWARSLAVLYTPLTGDEEREHQVASYLENLPVPVLGLYGSDDDLIAAETIDEAQRRNDHGQWLLYEGVGHGFADVNHPGFDQASADDAFARLIAFFGASLPKANIEDLG